ncbi:putative disease resistance protein, partial [Nymphaea thermarum]
MDKCCVKRIPEKKSLLEKSDQKSFKSDESRWKHEWLKALNWKQATKILRRLKCLLLSGRSPPRDEQATGMSIEWATIEPPTIVGHQQVATAEPMQAETFVAETFWAQDRIWDPGGLSPPLSLSCLSLHLRVSLEERCRNHRAATAALFLCPSPVSITSSPPLYPSGLPIATPHQPQSSWACEEIAWLPEQADSETTQLIVQIGAEQKEDPAMADALVGLVLDKLTALISDQVGVFCSAKKDLENLKSEMIAIRSTIKVADGLPYFMVEGLKDWLQKLKDVAYNAEDIIDKYQAKIHKNKQVYNPFANYFLALCDNHIRLRYKLGKDIKAINETLAQISKEKDRYHNILHEFATRSLQMTNDRATSCFIDKNDVVGRENDQTTLIQKLVGEDTTTGGGGCNVSIISIVGIGGVGKTTLAQMVFDNDQVKKHFGKSMWWVSILQWPNATDVTKRIVEQIKNEKDNVSELNTLIQLVYKTTSKNKFLLVLDDVWDLDWWERLEPVLIKKGAPGSRIIMTSRKEHISKGIGAAYMLELESLTHEESWELFLREALITKDELKRLNLEEIGRNIVSKCGGLPLVIQTVGKVMQSKERRREDWEFIADSKIWDLKIPSATSDSSLLPGLILSYDDLSPILKHYFTYFSLNQKGESMSKRFLIMNLMAHGLVENANERNME